MWRHVMVNTHGTWLPGCEKGFRNRRHRIHSSGDYKHPPPPDEHKGLRAYNRTRAKKPRTIPSECREAVGGAFVKRLRKEGCTVLAISVSAEHVHALVELPNDRGMIRKVIGRCKQYATRCLPPAPHGDLWADGGEFKPITERDHQLNVYEYILTRQGHWAWTWSFRDELDLPRFPEELFPHLYRKDGARRGKSEQGKSGKTNFKRSSRHIRLTTPGPERSEGPDDNCP
jgi:REP element-mobilizing transposase RayT